MSCRLSMVGAAALLAAACSSTPRTSTSTSTGEAGGSGGTGGEGGVATSTSSGSGGTGGEGGSTGEIPPVIEPSLFDCTAEKPPERVTTTAIACATDPACTSQLVSGHRGVGGDLGVIAPEDTLAAVRAAIVLGLDYIETDPRATADGHLVNLHDPEVDRTTFGTGAAADMTLAELQALKIRSDKYAGNYACETIPTLEQVLAEAKGKVHVLVDANKTDRIDLVVGAIVATGTLEWAIFDTDSVAKIDEALALAPALRTMIRVGSKNELELEMAHFAAHPPVIVEIHDGASPITMVPQIKSAGGRPLLNVFAQDVAASLNDKEDAYAQTLANGVLILQSDRPDLVLLSLERWPPPAQP